MAFCQSCGLPIPEGQHVCSMCYGDPFYGRDGYYLEELKEELRHQVEEEELIDLLNEEWIRQQEEEAFPLDPEFYSRRTLKDISSKQLENSNG